ncbi:MAG: DUF1566 domain-containing protein [Epsilonproteobacteria bacterium]|nr:DUF1566 domain-containing protein [Campylobacterota bacterium]
MKLFKYLIISLVLLSTLSYAKVVSGVLELNNFRDGSGNSFDVEITVKYKIETLMGEPVVKATAKYEIGQFIDIDGKSYTKDKLTKEQFSKLKIYDLVVKVPFDTTYTGQGTNHLYIDISMGAMGKAGEWSFNPPESPDWDKWIYYDYGKEQYLDKKEAIKAYKGLKRLGYGDNAYTSLASAKKIKYSVSDVKLKQSLKDVWIDKDTNLMWQDEAYTKQEIDNYMVYYEQGKNVRKTGSWYHAKKYCQNLTLNGFDDWKLPTIIELDGIKDKREHFKHKKCFRNIWSSMDYSDKKAKKFAFHYYDDGEKHIIWNEYKNNTNFIKCVRDIKRKKSSL